MAPKQSIFLFSFVNETKRVTSWGRNQSTVANQYTLAVKSSSVKSDEFFLFDETFNRRNILTDET